MKNNITDRKLLKAIYSSYYDEFCAFEKDNPDRTTKNYVALDLKKIGKKVNVDGAIIFGRLYYHLDKRYRYKQENGAIVSLFELKLGDEIHLINFPLMSAVLAEMEDDYSRFSWPLYLSGGALVVSIVAILLAA